MVFVGNKIKNADLVYAFANVNKTNQMTYLNLKENRNNETFTQLPMENHKKIHW